MHILCNKIREFGIISFKPNDAPCPISAVKPSKGCNCTRRFLVSTLGAAFLILPSDRRAMAKEKAEQAENFSPSGSFDPENEKLPRTDVSPEFFKTASGVKVQELIQGKGAGAQDGDRLEVEYVLRRSNGYFIYSTREGVSFQPRDVPTGPLELRLGDMKYIRGLQDALRGMKTGGKRRALIPPEQGYLSTSLQPQPPTFATQRQLQNHAREPLMFELQLLHIRN